MEWYLGVLKKYAVFSGRARRKEYWMFLLFNIVIAVVLTVVDVMAGLGDAAGGAGLLSGLYSLAVLLPGLAVTVRRLHDTSHSGWWILICLIPLIGVLVLLYFMIKESDAGDNEYGPNPKGAPAMPAAAPA